MARPPETHLEMLPDAEALARRAAEWLLDLALNKDGRFSIALSGGSTPRRLYEILAEPDFHKRFPWSRTDLFWGDERFVPHDDPHSNFSMVQKALLSAASIPSDHCHPMMTTGLAPDEAAAGYDRELREFFGRGQLDATSPLFDVTFLGLGPDGHIASLFPGSAALEERTSWVAAVTDSPQYGPRLTLTYPALESSRHVAFLVSGAEKQAIFHQLADGADLPAARLRAGGEVCWFVDEAAAANTAQEQP